MGSALGQRGFAGENLVRPIEQRVDFRKVRFPRIGIVGKGWIGLVIVRIDLPFALGLRLIGFHRPNSSQSRQTVIGNRPGRLPDHCGPSRP